MEINELMKKAVKFHGHSCPGLAIGVLSVKYILDMGDIFSEDEEIVAIVENDNCSVDAYQALLGTTFGKGNFIFLDYGKNNYTIYNRALNRAYKVSAKPKIFSDKKLSKEEKTEQILKSNPEDLFNIKEVEYSPPDFAQIHESIICSRCGDPTMATRIKKTGNNKLCIPCFENK